MTGKTPTLFDFLLAEYNKYRQELADTDQPDAYARVYDDADETVAPVESFVAWANDYLAMQNQPINTAYLTTGMGLRLQQGQIVGFRPQPENNFAMRDEGIHITRPQNAPGFNGIIPSESYPVLGSR